MMVRQAHHERIQDKQLLLKLLIFLTTFSLRAQEASHLFAQANSHYQKNECAQAIAQYEKIPHKGAATWYNMGNCAYKLNDQLKALLYWKRAYKYGNRHIQKESIANMKLLSIPYEPLSNPYANISSWIMQILFFCIFSVFLIVGYFLVRTRQWVFLAMSFAVLVSAARITHRVYVANSQALVMRNESAVRAGPGSEYHQLNVLSAGTTVQMVKHNQGWTQVSYHGTRGWIEDKEIEEI